MEQISSRKNAYIRHVRQLAADGAYRRERGEYLCDGMKTLREALSFGAKVSSILWKERAGEGEYPHAAQYVCPAELFDYASPMVNSPGPLFTVAFRGCRKSAKLRSAMILEGVQDPGNVGTVVRTANALGFEAVALVGACADLYSPKTARATMGAIFRQCVFACSVDQLDALLKRSVLPLYGAALTDTAQDVRRVNLSRAAVAVGSEGQGLSEALLARCDGEIIIPMQPDSESLNAAVAASLLMWEIVRNQ